MKPKSPALFDFRMTLSSEIDVVLTAKAKAAGLDKSEVVRELLTKWAREQRSFCEALREEDSRDDQRELRLQIRRKALSRRIQNAVFARDGFRCAHCGADPDDPSKLHVDHIVPVSAGGGNELANLRVLCATCNLSKADKIISLHAPESAGRGRR